MNLLPQSKQREIVIAYRMRLAAVAVFSLAVLGIVAGILLIPSYVITATKIDIAQRQLGQATQNGGSGVGTEDPKAVVGQVENKIAALMPADTGTLTPSQVVIELLSRVNPGISLSAVSFEAGPSGARLTVRGTALDRHALAVFGDSLSGDVLFTGVNIPPESFVKKSNIDFTIPIMLSTTTPATSKSVGQTKRSS